MSFLHALILGIVEGVTEFLPISSTGHMILASTILKIQQTEFVKSFEIVIQLGAILAVVVMYWKQLWRVEMIKKLIVAFIPTATIGFVLYKIVKHYFLGNQTLVLWALLIGGVVLIIFELLHKEKDTDVANVEAVSYRQAAAIGFFQCLSMVPGVSRSAATTVGGLLLGLKRRTIVEFSFLLAVPTMVAASGYDLLKSGSVISGSDWAPLAVGFVVAFVVAWFCIKWLLKFVQKHSFIGFGVYRILIAVLFWIIIL